MNLYEYWDDISSQCDDFHNYAFSNYKNIKTDFELQDCKKIISTYGRNLGIASPSNLTKFIVKNYKCGRIIKKVKPGQIYKVTYFDDDGFPQAIDLYDLCTSNDTNVKKVVQYIL